MSAWELFAGTDQVGRAVALLLLGMSVASWVVILWKLWLLPRAARGLRRGVAAFWQAPTLEDARSQVAAFDREALVLPLVDAARTGAAGTLAGAGSRTLQLTRALRDALHEVLARLQRGQVLLATVGATAPFVGLLGTVWGIHHALASLAQGGQVTIDRIAGPVGESLTMTAAGLAVAIPAVLAYNAFGRRVGALEATLEGFARDLRDLLGDGRGANRGDGSTPGTH